MSNKKDNEKELLQKSIEVGMKKGGLCKRLITMVAGDEINRVDNERPDFVVKYNPTNKNSKPILIGIEHFVVDQQAKKKGSKYRSTDKEIQAKLKEIYNKYSEEILKNEDCLDEAITDILKQVIDSTQSMLDSSYVSFIQHLKYVLIDKHAPNFSIYHRNLKKLAGDVYDTKLALLIEVKSFFSNLWVYDDRGRFYSDKPIIPLFNDFVEIIKTTCSKDIDLIILCFTYPNDRQRFDVVTVRPRTIEADLRKQRLRIYQYVSSETDSRIKIVQNKNISKDDAGYSFATDNTYSIDEDMLIDNINKDAAIVFNLIANNQNFVTNGLVLEYLELLGILNN